MKTKKIPIESMLVPSYVTGCIKNLEWIEKDEKSITFYDDDFLMIFYGVRGSTAFSGPDHIRYGSNTTAYQIWSPKLPLNVLYLGDGGSGMLEIDDAIIGKLFSKGINPFTQANKDVAPVVENVINTYTHYHYDHLHMGTPLAGLFHANSIKKTIIGGDNPKRQFSTAFKRPAFPRDFGEIQGSYSFYDLQDPRSSVIVFTPNGEFRVLTSSDFANYIQGTNPQIRHNKVSYNLEDCVVVRCNTADHPDPCIAFRYEYYDSKGENQMAVTFLTDHEIRETDYMNKYFLDSVNNANLLYIDGQYTNDNYIPGFGHGRIEIIGKTAASLSIDNILIGHHDPKRRDDEIDAMVEKARENYRQAVGAGDGEVRQSRIVGATDRMLVFIPGKQRGRKGIVFGRMSLNKKDEVDDEIGFHPIYDSIYNQFDLTSTYKIDDYTIEG